MATGAYNRILLQVERKIETETLAVFQAVATEATRRIIDRTPVKTGRARANTHLLVNAADPPTSDDTDPSGSAAKSRATGNAQLLKLGDAAVIANGLDYVAGLESGTSKQAGDGMYGVTRIEIPSIFEAEMRAAFK